LFVQNLMRPDYPDEDWLVPIVLFAVFSQARGVHRASFGLLNFHHAGMVFGVPPLAEWLS
ncbi:hypothetical protein, partial [Pseudomonas syringae group genomosp. 3]|uniref:hypothetical protein n=1 Tax=Pseudomonas syringae group genomosp. 3 TaxID=251701 RepID=UPI001C3F22C1